MAQDTEEAILRIDGDTSGASASIKELAGQIKYLQTALENMHKEDNPALYESRIRQINMMTDALSAQRAELLNDTVALRGNREEFAAAGAQMQQTAGKVDLFQKALNRVTDISAIGARAVNMLSRQIIGLGVGFLSATIGAKAIESLFKYIAGLRMFHPLATQAQLAQKELNAAFASSEYNKAIKDINELTINIGLAKKGFLDKTKVLKEYNTTLGSSIGYANNLDDAEKNIVKNGDAFIKVTLLKSAAQLALADAAKKAYEAAQIANKKAEEFANAVVDTRVASQGGSFNAADYDADTKRIEEARKARQKQQVDDANDQKNKLIKIGQDFQQQAAALAKQMNLDFFDGTEDDKKLKSTESAYKKKLEAQKKFMEESRTLTEQFSEFSKSETADRETKEKKEQDELTDKFDKEIQKEKDFLDKNKNNIYKNDAEMQAHRDQIAKLEAQKTTDLNALKLKQAQELQANLKKEAEKALKETEEQLKAVEDQIKAVKDAAMADLEAGENKDISGIKAADPKAEENQRLIIQQEYAQKRFDLEQKFLEMQKEIYTAYGKDTASTDKQIADNAIKEAIREEKAKEQWDQKEKAARKEIQNQEMDDLQQGAAMLESVLNKKSALYAAALIVDKAVAVARVIIDTNVAIAAFTAANAGIPVVGEALVAQYTTVARIGEAISIAEIVAATASSLGGGSSSSKNKKAKGGLIEGPGHESGGVPLIDGNTGKPVAEVEGGETVAVFSKAATRNNRSLINQLLYSSMHNNGAAVDTGNISTGIRMDRGGYLPQFSNAAGTGSTGRSHNSVSTGVNSMSETNRLLLAVHDKLDDIGKRPIDFNYRASDNYTQLVAATKAAANAA